MEKLEKQECPVCHKKTLTLTEDESDIPYFGKVYLFSMNCEDCGYHKADLEAMDKKYPCKITFEVQNKKDLSVRVVKSSEASIKIPQLRMSLECGPSSNGYVTNIEGVLNRFKKIVEEERDSAEEPEVRKKAKNLLKKFRKVELGDMPLKIIIEDKSGNSAIISQKAVISKLK